jgi:SAM-dependent methyltransferase
MMVEARDATPDPAESPESNQQNGRQSTRDQAALSRLSPRKVAFLAAGVAQLRRDAMTLEIFAGSGVSTAVLRGFTRRLVSLDIDPRYAAGAERFVCADARRLPFADGSFDFVIAPDPPRTAWNRFLSGPADAGAETDLNPAEQQQLFRDMCAEAGRVLRAGGVLATTAPRTWLAGLPLDEIRASSARLQFRSQDVIDPVVYARFRKPV